MWVGRLSNKRANVTAVAFAPDGRTIYTGDSTGWVRAWDVMTHESQPVYQRTKTHGRTSGVYSLWPTPDGSRLLLDEDPVLRDALHPATPVLKASVSIGGDWRYLLPDGKRFISCERDWRVGLWDLATGEQLTVPGTLGKAKDITYHNLLPDGVTLLTYETKNDEIQLWNFSTGKRIDKLSPSAFGINPCAMANDGITLVVGRTGELWVYDVPSRKLRHKLKTKKTINEIAFHPGGQLVALASNDDHLISLWDATAGKQITQFDWSTGRIESLTFSPDGLTCAVAGRSLIVFDIDL